MFDNIMSRVILALTPGRNDTDVYVMFAEHDFEDGKVAALLVWCCIFFGKLEESESRHASLLIRTRRSLFLATC